MAFSATASLYRKALKLVAISGVLLAIASPLTAQPGSSFVPGFQASGSGAAGAQAKMAAVLSQPGNSTDYYYDSQTSSWVHFGNSTYTYTPDGKLTEKISTEVGTNQILGKDTYTYDAFGNETEFGRYSWFNNNYMLFKGHRHTYLYNAAGKKTEDIYEEWSFSGWNKKEKRNLTYLPDGNLADETFSYFDMSTNTWEPQRKDTYVYTNGLITAVLGQTMVNGTWALETQTINITWHKVNESPSAFLMQQFSNNNWHNHKQMSAVYDANGGYARIWQNWTGGAWVNNTRETASYDIRKNYIGSSQEIWSVNNLWVKDAEEQQLLTYSPTDDITERIYMFWDPQAGSLQHGQKLVYSNFQYFVTGIKKDLATFGADIYPNPVKNDLTVHLSEISNQPVNLIITDITGKLLQTSQMPAGLQQISLNTEALRAGIYLLQLQTADRKQTFKLLKQ